MAGLDRHQAMAGRVTCYIDTFRSASMNVRKTTHAGGKSRRWSHKVMERSDALTLEKGIFKSDDSKRIARSLKRSALRSRRRKSDPFRSAMSMLTFYINRAGRTLSKRRIQVLERAKQQLRVEFHRE
jgi:hypothetical protein